MPNWGLDLERVRPRLDAWLRERSGRSDLRITELSSPASSGFSSETVLITATGDPGDGPAEQHFVVRTAPSGHTVFPRYDLGLQFDVMAKVAAHSKVPVPPLRWYEHDPGVLGGEFYVMDRVDGLVPPDNLPYTMDGWLKDASAEHQRALQGRYLDVLADLHALDWRAAGLDVLDQPAHGRTGLDQQVGFYEWFYEWGREEDRVPLIEESAAWLRANLPEDEPEPVLNWGDARIGNIIWNDFHPAAVLDWEMATLGPPEVDVAWEVTLERFFSDALGVPNLPGFRDRAGIVAAYERRSGRTLTNLDWYVVWAAHRYAVVFMRLVQGFERTGIDSGQTLESNLAFDLLRTVLDELSTGGGN